MSRYSIRIIIVLGVLAIGGIIPIQVYWVTRAFDLREKQFNQNVQVALKRVAEEIRSFNNTQAPVHDPVSQLSSSYFVVNVQDVINTQLLEYYLKREFEKVNLQANYEYGIYDCQNDKMVYGNFISQPIAIKEELQLASQPILPNESYYFTLYFPSKAADIMLQMPIWIFSSGVFLLVVFFFGYTLWVVLEQKRLAEMQRDFINNMTHEFKTPLATIAVSSEVLKNAPEQAGAERIKNYARIIHEEAHRLKSQVERVLQIAVDERSSTKINRQQVDVHALIQQSVKNIEPYLADKQGNIVLALDAESATILGDELHLGNIFYNLLDNSIKYSEKPPHIHIYSFTVKGFLCLSITDNGIGIPENLQKKVFEKFYRVPTGNVHDVKGFGLGLCYVKEMVLAHKGKLTISSKLGEGTVVLLKFPLA
ncbi:HAMP domain-containing sensor histidine kinase [Cytophagales bacterium LB-30]|uniref:histidine kinase n=1 Tax=Shiella aurantiaca TaxID=3058365 RepID=A0ABT8F889_9BACT|nr:HAMP domain-containing sensor histidine kinase [Shiella aurantiaca]MDN4166161.1 HAMP domain-containing sensor histidine kinase [Shiella aurantiaca]